VANVELFLTKVTHQQLGTWHSHTDISQRQVEVRLVLAQYKRKLLIVDHYDELITNVVIKVINEDYLREKQIWIFAVVFLNTLHQLKSISINLDEHHLIHANVSYIVVNDGLKSVNHAKIHNNLHNKSCFI
jgi:hypothetical protein